MTLSKISHFSKNNYPVRSSLSNLSRKLPAIAGVVFLLFLLVFSGCSLFTGEDFDLLYKVYIPSKSANSLVVIPPEKSKEIKTIDIPRSINMIARVPGSDTLFVLVSGNNEIVPVNTKDDIVGDTFRFEVGSAVAQTNNRILFNSSGSKAYLTTSYEPSGLAVMEVSNRTFLKGINLYSTSLGRPFFSGDGSRLYIPDPSKRYIYEIDTVSDVLIQNIPLTETFGEVLRDPTSGRFYITSGSSVKEYDPVEQAIVRTIENVTPSPVRMIFNENNTSLLVLGNREIVTIQLSDFTLTKRVTLDFSSPGDIQFLPDRSYLLVPSADSNLVMLLDPTEFSGKETISTGTSPGEMVILPEKFQKETSSEKE